MFNSLDKSIRSLRSDPVPAINSLQLGLATRANDLNSKSNLFLYSKIPTPKKVISLSFLNFGFFCFRLNNGTGL